MNEMTIDEFDAGLEPQELSDEQIDEVSGGLAPALWGLYLGGAGFGFSVGQGIWGN